MLTVKPEQRIKRDATIYTRVQAANKNFLMAESKRLKFDNVAEYLDAILTKIRVSAKTPKVKTVKKKAEEKK